jgi:hypothetical protein
MGAGSGRVVGHPSTNFAENLAIEQFSGGHSNLTYLLPHA